MKQIDRIELKIDQIDQKLDVQGERISAAETSIAWLRGHLKFSLSVAIALVGAVVAGVIQGNITW